MVAKEDKKFDDKTIGVEDAVEIIMECTDKRARKVFFPTKAWYSNYVRPLFPNYVDRNLKKRLMSKL